MFRSSNPATDLLASLEMDDHPKAFRLIKKYGINAQNRDDGVTALHRAAENRARKDRNLETVAFLLENGADVHAVDNHCYTPLHCACWWNNESGARLLAANGANIHAKTDNGWTPLHMVSLLKIEVRISEMACVGMWCRCHRQR